MSRRPRLRVGRRAPTGVIVLLVLLNPVLVALALHRRSVQAGRALWLQAAGDTYRSTDGGATFTSRGA